MKKAIATTLILVFALLNSAMAEEFSADIILQSRIGDTSGKIYFKNVDVNRHDVMGVTVITKRPLVYQIFDSTKKYVVKDIKELAKEYPMANATSFEEWLDRNHMRATGRETLQGFECTIYQGKITFSEGQSPAPMKVWYSKKLGYPMRMETTLEPPMGAMTHSLENIKIGPQPASLFQIPAGYKKVNSVEDAMGTSGFGLPSMTGSQGGPSQEDIDNMKEQIEEMMKNMQKK